LFGSRFPLLENGAIVEVSEVAYHDGKGSPARVIEQEESGRQLLEMYLIPDDLDTRVGEEAVSALP
jgi:hypothetical protein